MSTKILVVDDEVVLQPLMQQRFRHKIQAGHYVFRFTTSGQKALDALKEDPDVDVILLDINMPDIDGLTLLGKLPELVPTSRAVMVSAYGDMKNVRTAMNRGAFDFVMKPIDFQDLEATIEKTALHIGQLRESIRIKAVADLKARFFDNITHEFRTPLSLIIAPVDTLLQNPQQDEQTRRSLTTIRRNAHQLLYLINQLLDLARLEADSLPIHESGGNVVAFVAQLVESFRSIADQKTLALTYSANVLEKEALFDADKWEKILTNLLSNAVKFTSPKGQITIACQVESTMVKLRVSDTGIGIPAHHLPHIFDRFYQVDTSLNRAYEGSGIGLALAYELTKWLGGSLSVESVPDAGTTFRVELPLKSLYRTGKTKPTTETLMTMVEPERWLSEPVLASETPIDSTKPLVLLVEDNAELLYFMVESLSNQYRILTASNGRDGLYIAQHELPEVVVSDVMMPVQTGPAMDGYQLTRQLKTNPTTDHIAVMLLTARAGVVSRREGLSEGADDYLTKPFDLDELRLRLNNLITRQQKLREYYQRQLSSLPASGAPNPATEEVAKPVQDAFLTRLNHIIEAHLDDSTFRAESLADEVAMSIRTLTRKLTTLAGISPARMIRTYRLRRATDLLRAGHPVSETAYLVGFEHPANFATAFKEVYQQTPSEFILLGSQGDH